MGAVPSLIRFLQISEADAILRIIKFIARGQNADGLKQAVPAVVELLDHPSYESLAVNAIFTMSAWGGLEIKRSLVAEGALPKLRRLAATEYQAQLAIDKLLSRS